MGESHSFNMSSIVYHIQATRHCRHGATIEATKFIQWNLHSSPFFIDCSHHGTSELFDSVPMQQHNLY